MRNEIPAVRILPMSDKLPGFRNRTIEEVQRRVFLRSLPKMNGRYHYRASGLNAPSGTIVLFQFKARVIASAVLVRDEKFERPIRGHAGILHFKPTSFRTFDAVDGQTMRKVWPWFRRFGHVKQVLNPEGYRAFCRRLKRTQRPA